MNRLVTGIYWYVMYLLAVFLLLISVVLKADDNQEGSYVTASCGNEIFISDTSCHHIYAANDIPIISGEKFRFPDDSIFFIETSCSGGLNFRQACAVESAARAHPRKKINVLFAGPVSENCLRVSPMTELLKYKNINFHRIYVDDFVKNTPLEDLIKTGVLNRSHFPVHHTSDVLRYVTLYKYGGTYLDLDVVVAKSFDGLYHSKNWLGMQSNKELSSSLLSLSKFGIGQRISYTTLRRMRDKFRIESWQYNRIGVLTEILQLICGTKSIRKMNARICQGLNVYEPAYFFPVSYENCNKYFAKYDGEPPQKPFAFHIWNYLTQNETIYNDSLYAQLIKLYCPRIYKVMS